MLRLGIIKKIKTSIMCSVLLIMSNYRIVATDLYAYIHLEYTYFQMNRLWNIYFDHVVS